MTIVAAYPKLESSVSAPAAATDPTPMNTLVATRRRARTETRSAPVNSRASSVVRAVRCAASAPTATQAVTTKAVAVRARQYAPSATP
jgi:hypothetical protein